MDGRSDSPSGPFPVRAALLAAGLAVIAGPSVSPAGEWHRMGFLRCTDCHTMHNSASGGTPMRYDGDPNPADLLLRASGPTQLCLACHSGGGQAPRVRTPPAV